MKRNQLNLLGRIRFMKITYCACCTLVLTSQESVAQQVPIRVLTEATPFTTIKHDDENSGEATIFVNRVIEAAGYKYHTSYIPWKRAYQIALSEPDILIYPIARTKQRDNQFEWVGNISPVTYFLFRLQSRQDISLNKVSDAKPYSLGVVNKHAHHEYLVSRGFENFQLVNSSAQNLRKLLLGRIDLFPLSSAGLEPLCKQLAVNCAEVVPAIALENFTDGLWLAFSKGSAPGALKQLRTTFEEKRHSGEYSSLFRFRNASASTVEENIIKPNIKHAHSR